MEREAPSAVGRVASSDQKSSGRTRMLSRFIAATMLAALAGVATIATFATVGRAQPAAPAEEPNRADLPPQQFNPQLSALMNMLIQPRHAKLGLAGKAEN